MKYLLFISILIAYHAATARADGIFQTYSPYPNGGNVIQQGQGNTAQSISRDLEDQRIRQQLLNPQPSHCTYQQNSFGVVTQTCN